MSALKPSCMDTQTGLVPHGAMEEHLPLCHFQFWSSCMYLKSLQMPLQVQSGLPDIFNQSQIISIIRICRIMLKSFPSLNCSALHFRRNTDDQNEHEIADPYVPKPSEGPESHLEESVPPGRVGKTAASSEQERQPSVTTNIQNNPQAALQISSGCGTSDLCQIIPKLSTVSLIWGYFLSPSMKKKNKTQIIISRCSVTKG